VNINSSPFPHVVLDGLWDDALLRTILDEFPEAAAEGWIRYTDEQHEVKLEGPADMWGDGARELVRQMVAKGPELAAAFGLPELFLRAEGGGYHRIEPGGRLAVHADFNRSEDGLFRRLNMIVYLNEDWTEADGGALELWDDGGKAAEILPTFNRTLVFETSDRSFHGHPTPLPGPRPRRSFAAYYFTTSPPPHYDHDHDTIWHPNGTATTS
jgi:hypothetical protein